MSDNDHLRIECTADGEWIIMPPTAGDTSDRNAELTMQLRIWATVVASITSVPCGRW